MANLETYSPMSEDIGPDTVGGTESVQPDLVKQSPTESLAEIEAFFQRTRQERRPHEIKWFVNAAAVKGEAGAKWNHGLSRLETRNQPSHRVRRSINLIRPKVKARLAKFIKQRPLPIVVAASTNREAVMNAKVTEKVLAYLWRKLGLEAKYEDVILWAMITGKAYWWLHWNPSAVGQIKLPDDPMTGQQGQVVDAQLGDIQVEVGTAFEFLPGDIGISRLQDQYEIMRVKVRDVSEVQARYPDAGEIKADTGANDLFQFEKQIANLGGRNIGYALDTSGKNSDRQTKVVVKELFTRPCAAYPSGRYRVGAGGQLLKDEMELPYDFGDDVANPFPVIEFCDGLDPGQYWPTTMVEQLLGLQLEYTDLRNKIYEQLKLQAHPKLFVWKQMNLAPNAYNSEPGEKIEGHFVPGLPGPPTFLNPPNIAADTWRILPVIKEEFDDVSQIRPADEGQVSNSGESGFQTNLLQEASESIHTPDIRRNEMAIEEFSFKARKMMSMGYDQPRLVAIAGKNMAPDVFEFSQDNIDEHAQIIVQAGSALPTLKAAKAKMITEMFQMGLFGNPQDPAVQRRVLEMLEVGGTENAIDVIRRDEDMARMENLKVSKGEPIEPPMPWQNHQVQYDIHADQLKSPETEDWSQPQKDELIKHLILHARFINPQNAMMLAQQFGYTDVEAIIAPLLPPQAPPAPPGPPPPPPGPTAQEQLQSNKEIAQIQADAKVKAATVSAEHDAHAKIAVGQHKSIGDTLQALHKEQPPTPPTAPPPAPPTQ